MYTDNSMILSSSLPGMGSTLRGELIRWTIRCLEERERDVYRVRQQNLPRGLSENKQLRSSHIFHSDIIYSYN